MQRASVTWGQVLRVWFAFTWPATGAYFLLCGGCFFGALLCVIFLIKFLHWEAQYTLHLVVRYYVASLVLNFPLAGLIAFQLLLKAQFPGFRLSLVALEAATAEENDLPPLNWVEPVAQQRLSPPDAPYRSAAGLRG